MSRLTSPESAVLRIMQEAEPRLLSQGEIADLRYKRGTYAQRRSWIVPVLLNLKKKGYIRRYRGRHHEFVHARVTRRDLGS